MLASFVLALVMIPIMSLIFGGVKQTTVGRDQATAVSLATNIMSQLLDKVPYEEFKPGEGPEPLDPAQFFQAKHETQGKWGTEKQCALGDADSAWEAILDQDPSTEGRTIFKEGTTFEVILFAGIYKDVDKGSSGSFNAPSLTEELTFSYFRNPWIEMDGTRQSEVRQMVVLDGDYPYDSPGKSPSSSGRRIKRVDDPRFQPGWPKTSHESKTVHEKNFYTGDGSTVPGTGEDPNEHTTLTWPRFTFDLHDFREDKGAMLKLVLGIRWKPGAGNNRGSDTTKTTREFWLVSFKAKLEEN